MSHSPGSWLESPGPPETSKLLSELWVFRHAVLNPRMCVVSDTWAVVPPPGHSPHQSANLARDQICTTVWRTTHHGPRKVLDSLSFSPIRKVWAFLVQSGEMGLCCVEGETSGKGMEGPAWWAHNYASGTFPSPACCPELEWLTVNSSS